MPPNAAERQPRYRSKTVTAWLALLLGSLGAHRFYLYGLSDKLGWLFPLPTLIGFFGAQRMRDMGADDAWSGLLVLPLGVTLSVAMLAAIVAALTPDEKWDARHNPGQPAHASGWGAVLAAAAGLFLGATVLLSTVAFGGQRFFEWMAQPAEVKTAITADVNTVSR